MAKEKEDGKEKDVGGEDEAAGSQKSSKKKLIIFVAIGVIAVGAIGGGAFMFLSGGKTHAPEGTAEKTTEENDPEGKAAGDHSPEGKTEEGGHEKATEGHAESSEGGEKSKSEKGDGKEKDHKSAKEEGSAEGNSGFGKSFALKPFNLNLGNPVENHFIRLELSLEYKGSAAQEGELNSRTPQLRDAIISVTSRKTREFLLSPDGKDRLRYELLNQLNSLLTQPVENVFITDMIIE